MLWITAKASICLPKFIDAGWWQTFDVISSCNGPEIELWHRNDLCTKLLNVELWRRQCLAPPERNSWLPHCLHHAWILLHCLRRFLHHISHDLSSGWPLRKMEKRLFLGTKIIGFFSALKYKLLQNKQLTACLRKIYGKNFV